MEGLLLATMIPKETQFFDILQVPIDANRETIVKQFRQLSMKLHPDKNLDKRDEYTEKFQELNEAHQVLTNDRERDVYILMGREGLQQLKCLDEESFSILFNEAKNRRIQETLQYMKIEPEENLVIESEVFTSNPRKRKFTEEYQNDSLHNFPTNQSSPIDDNSNEKFNEIDCDSSQTTSFFEPPHAARDNNIQMLQNQLEREIKKKQCILRDKHNQVRKERAELETEKKRFEEEKKEFQAQKQQFEADRIRIKLDIQQEWSNLNEDKATQILFRENVERQKSKLETLKDHLENLKEEVALAENRLTESKFTFQKEREHHLQEKEDWINYILHERRQLSKCLVLHQADWSDFTCLLCNQRYTNTECLQDHLEKHGDNFCTCPICFFSNSHFHSCDTLEDLILHLQTTHNYMMKESPSTNVKSYYSENYENNNSSNNNSNEVDVIVLD